jgi:hypothetical protein
MSVDRFSSENIAAAMHRRINQPNGVYRAPFDSFSSRPVADSMSQQQVRPAAQPLRSILKRTTGLFNAMPVFKRRKPQSRSKKHTPKEKRAYKKDLAKRQAAANASRVISYPEVDEREEEEERLAVEEVDKAQPRRERRAPRQRSRADGSAIQPLLMRDPDDASGENHAAITARNELLLRANHGMKEYMNLRPFRAADGETQTRTVTVTIKGYYELFQGSNNMATNPNDTRHEKTHVFNITFTSYAKLVKGVREAFVQLEEMIQALDVDSGYKVFYPMTYYADDSYSVAELARIVRNPTEIEMYAPVPIQYGNLKRMGVDVALSTPDEGVSIINCVTKSIWRHFRENSIMKRVKWTEEKIARSILGLADDAEIPDMQTRGYSVKDVAGFFATHEVASMYAFDQFGNVLQDVKLAHPTKPPFMFVSHNAHCYVITDVSIRKSLVARVKASCNKTSSSIIKKEGIEAIQAAKKNQILELMKLPKIKFHWNQHEPLDMARFSKYKDCNLFFDQKCMLPVLIEILRQKKYVHTCEHNTNGISRVNYFNGVTFWANPNTMVNAPKLKYVGGSGATIEFCKRLNVDFTNQSVGSAVKEFGDLYHNALGGKSLRERISPADRLRYATRFNHTCNCCCKKIDNKFEIDHKIPLMSGGTNDDSNLQLLCVSCHDKKSRMEINSKIYKVDRTISHYNAGTLPVFSGVKNAVVHNFIASDYYADIIFDESDLAKPDHRGNRLPKKKLVIKPGMVVAGLDLNKCRTNLLLHGMKLPFPVLSVLDDVQPFDAGIMAHTNIPVGEYYVHTQTICPAKGNGWYTQVEVQYMLEENIIQIDAIKWIIAASLSHNGNYYKEFVQSTLDRLIISKPGTAEYDLDVFMAKTGINQWVGQLGIRSNDSKNVSIYTDLIAAATDSHLRMPGQSTVPVSATEKANRDRLQQGQHVAVTSMMFDRNDASNYDKNGAAIKSDYILYTHTKTKIKKESYTPIFRAILGAEAVELHKMVKLLRQFGGKVCHVNTDNAIAVFEDRMHPDNKKVMQTAQEQVDLMWAYSRKATWDDEGKIFKYKRADKPSVYLLEREEKVNEDAYKYTPPAYKVMPDPGNDDFETLARKIVTQLLDPECDGSLQIDAAIGYIVVLYVPSLWHGGTVPAC